MLSLFGFGTILGLLKERISAGYPSQCWQRLGETSMCINDIATCCKMIATIFCPQQFSGQYQAVQFVGQSGEESVVLGFQS